MDPTLGNMICQQSKKICHRGWAMPHVPVQNAYASPFRQANVGFWWFLQWLQNRSHLPWKLARLQRGVCPTRRYKGRKRYLMIHPTRTVYSRCKLRLDKCQARHSQRQVHPAELCTVWTWRLRVRMPPACTRCHSVTFSSELGSSWDQVGSGCTSCWGFGTRTRTVAPDGPVTPHLSAAENPKCPRLLIKILFFLRL